MEATLPPLIEQMLQPEFYSHPVDTPIQLLQTHISYVLLTGEYAYKVKKPANFGFLDFTSLEQRRHFCQEELRLNRRLSPELYLAVLPIAQTATGDRYQLLAADSAEPGAEYTIQMRQFPQACLFSHLFAEGKLTVVQMQQLGQQVAEFHQRAATSPEIQAFGSVAAVQQVDENNYALSQSFVGRTQTADQLAATQAFTRGFFRDRSDWLTERQTSGKVRECHGDLHLNNICLFQQEIQVFDCIEFNQEFRCIDVIYDAAYLVMDLEFQGRSDLANAFLNAYLEATGDYTGAVLLPLYLSMRAYIRGNVNSLALNDPAITQTEKQKIHERAAAYYHRAWEYTQPQQGQLILMSGLSGSGKTTVARQVAQNLNAIHIRSDAVRKHLAGVPLYERAEGTGTFGGGIYTPEMAQKTYDRLLELGLLLAQQGRTVVLDAKYDRRDLRQAVLEQAQAAGIAVKILYCTAPLEVLRDRLQNRKGDIADATADLLDDQQKAAEPLTEQEQPLVTTIHTEQDLQPQLAGIGLA